MNEKTFKLILAFIAVAFTVTFCILVVPALVNDFDIIGAFAAGFVNPYAAGYSSDVLFCWATLFVWVIYEAKVLSVKYGWVCLVLGVVPGVAVGFALYLILRTRQINQSPVK
jgi:uncharacterized protein DUF2834